MNTHPTKPRYLMRTAELAEHYGVSRSFFEKLRVSGLGPEYIQVSRWVYYDPETVDAWFLSHRRNNTSQPKQGVS